MDLETIRRIQLLAMKVIRDICQGVSFLWRHFLLAMIRYLVYDFLIG